MMLNSGLFNGVGGWLFLGAATYVGSLAYSTKLIVDIDHSRGVLEKLINTELSGNGQCSLWKSLYNTCLKENGRRVKSCMVEYEWMNKTCLEKPERV